MLISQVAIILFSNPHIDGLVKSLQGRHSREGGSPEVVDFPGFPPSRELRKRVLSDFLLVCQNSNTKTRNTKQLPNDQNSKDINKMCFTIEI